jgi:DNA-directed RNA polymerase subunit RPC12/RpoP
MSTRKIIHHVCSICGKKEEFIFPEIPSKKGWRELQEKGEIKILCPECSETNKK